LSYKYCISSECRSQRV